MNFRLIPLFLLVTAVFQPVFGMEQPDIEAGLSKRFMKHLQHKENNVSLEQTIDAVKQRFNAIDPDPTISQLATDAIHNCGLNPKDIHVLQMNGSNNAYATTQHNRRFIALGVKEPYLDQITFAAYHECGHHALGHQKTEIKRLFEAKKGILLGSLATIVGSTLWKATSIPGKIGKVLAVGSGIVTSAITGTYHWRQPSQGQEFDADTFAHKKLLEKGDVSVCVGRIVDEIQEFERSGSIILRPIPFESHPSAYHRAAHGVKVLREAGIDFNKLQEIDPQLAKIATEQVNKYFPESK